MTNQNDVVFRQVARALQAEIDAGRWAIGESLPTRAQLMERFGVARATIDKAIAVLVRSGLLTSRQGSGTVVANTSPPPAVAVIGSPLPGQDLPLGTARITSLGYDQIATASARRSLTRYDGLLWNRPEREAIAWARSLAGQVPQVLINRVVADFHCVSTDHRGAYRAITGERLDALPAGQPVFLRTATAGSLVTAEREAGFVEACRARQRYFEPLALPDDFAAAVAVLDAALRPDAARPLIVVSASLHHTGAVMAWARDRGVVWQGDAWYSDFDNDLPTSIWGLAVTSFIQEDRRIHAAALETLLRAIREPAGPPQQQTIMPRFRAGQT